MPVIGPIKGLRQFGFTGQFPGGKHQFVIKGNLRVRIPNPHTGDIGVHLLKKILAEAGIDAADWEKI